MDLENYDDGFSDDDEGMVEGAEGGSPPREDAQVVFSSHTGNDTLVHYSAVPFSPLTLMSKKVLVEKILSMYLFSRLSIFFSKTQNSTENGSKGGGHQTYTFALIYIIY